MYVSLEYALATMASENIVYWNLRDGSHNNLASCQSKGISLEDSHGKLRDAIGHISGGVVCLLVYDAPTIRTKADGETPAKGGAISPSYKWYINLGSIQDKKAVQLPEHDRDQFKYMISLIESSNRAIYEAKQEAAQARIDAQIAKLEAKYSETDKGENLTDLVKLLIPILSKQAPAPINEAPRQAPAPTPAPENAKERLSAVLTRLTNNGVTLDHMEKIAGLVEQDPSLINVIAGL